MKTWQRSHNFKGTVTDEYEAAIFLNNGRITYLFNMILANYLSVNWKNLETKNIIIIVITIIIDHLLEAKIFSLLTELK